MLKKRIKGLFKPTPAQHRRRRNIAIAIGTMAEGAVTIGMVDDRPILKNILHLVALGFGTKAIFHQSTTHDDHGDD